MYLQAFVAEQGSRKTGTGEARKPVLLDVRPVRVQKIQNCVHLASDLSLLA